jgi:hypothetical protein
MQTDIFDFPAVWRDTRKAILRERSVLLAAPKHYGKQFFSNHLSADEQILDRFSVVSLSPTGSPPAGLDYFHLWEDLSAQLEIRNGPVRTGDEFEESLLSLSPRKKVLFILRVNGQNKKPCIQLLDAFQKLSHEHSYLFLKYFTLLVLDDLSLYFYERSVRDQFSFWDFFQHKPSIPLFTDIVSVNEFLRKMPAYQERTSTYSNIILQLSGGHQGMVYELLGFVAEQQPARELFRKECRQHLLNSHIVDSIRQTLQKSTDHADLALSYKKRSLFNDIGPIMEDLFRAGIVLRADSIDAVLCSGIVTDIVETVYNATVTGKSRFPVRDPDEPSNGHPAQTVREVFFSYKHIDKALIDKLYQEVNALPGLRGIIDDKDLPFSESISAFAHRIGEGNFVVVAISQEYIRSLHCMFEFYELYRHSQLDADKMMKKMLPIRLEEIDLNDPRVSDGFIRYWRETKEVWDRTVSENPDQALFKTHEKVRNIYNNLGEMLEIINDIKSMNPAILTADNFDGFLNAIINRKN